MKLICGLGNPGEKYENSRHNAGFMFLDSFAIKHEFPNFVEKWNALVSEKGLGDEKIILIKPTTFMNLSGEAVLKFFKFYKLHTSDIFLVYDDVDLRLGELRFRDKGGAGTHNGMKSVISLLGTDEFPRLRLGIESRGVSAPELMDLHAFVLTPFSEEERSVFKNVVEEAVEVLENKLANS